MTPDGLIEVSDLERWATEATAAGIDPVLVLAERDVQITAHGDGWIELASVHLDLGRTGWHATMASPRVETGSALIGGRR